MPALGSLADALGDGRRVVASGSAGSSTNLVAGALARRLSRPVALIMAHPDEADAAADELTSSGILAMNLPALETLPGESGLSLGLLAERFSVLRRIASLDPHSPAVLVAAIQSLMQAIPPPDALASISKTLTRDEALRVDDLSRWLVNAGYDRVETIEEIGEFSIRGGLVDVFTPAGPPIRLDFFGDEIESIHEIDIETMGSDRAIESAELVAVDEEVVRRACAGHGALQLVPERAVVIVHETLEVAEQGRGYHERAIDARGIFAPSEVLRLAQARFHALAEVNQFSSGSASADLRLDLPFLPPPELPADAREAVRELLDHATRTPVVVPCENQGELQRLNELLDEAGESRSIERGVACLRRGFLSDHPRCLILPYHELLHRFHARRTHRLRATRAIDTFLDFAPGDCVVHAEHGIARFLGLKPMKPARAAHGNARDPEEYLILEFAKRSRLYVPAIQIDQVQKYVGGSRGEPPLSMLGGQKWKNQKEKVFEALKGLAAELLRVRAAREAVHGIRYPADTAWQKDFEDEFPYDETEDQLAAMAAIKRDMQQARPMDRLVCGDVGFGKTELAIRAAFKAIESGRQVAVLVPTTVLAEQHERTFRERFAGYPFRVESISRFKTEQETARILADLRKGHVDAIVGTHRLLSKDVHFADLGLVVIDEEQRFGVEHKEQLLRLRLSADVLTLSATPIPRTLHMSLLGLRDISSLAIAPADRQAVVTDVIPWDERRIRHAIERELSRDGQVFYVHNRVHDIQTVADDLRRLVPDARIVVGHGQMRAGELEDVMLRFTRRHADVLVCTTIIESGIDIPTANTIIICDADRFGLADLHQLRGRVGRYKHRAYCYLLLPRDRLVTDKAKKRLRAIEEYSMLGAGFKIAMRDLEIRGAGNLLGAEQSGHIAAVGYDMYCRLLDRAVRQLRREDAAEPHHTSIEIGVPCVIPKAYIPSDQRRMDAYRRIAQAHSDSELQRVERDLGSAYGQPPRQVERLLELARVRLAASAIGIRSVTIRGPDVVFRTPHPHEVTSRLNGAAGTVRVPATGLDGDVAEVYFRPPGPYLEPDTLLAVLARRFTPGKEDALTAAN